MSDEPECLNITFTQLNNSNINLFVVVSYIRSAEFHIWTDFLVLKNFFSLNDYSSSDGVSIAALKGYAFVEHKTEKCPFATIAIPYHFNDETEIIYLQTFYHNFTNNAFSTKDENYCKWNFTAPSGYGFKMVLISFDVLSTNEFTAVNTTDVIVNKRSAKIWHPYYNDDKSIQITISKAAKDFQAYVSIVKTNPVIVEGNCTTNIDLVGAITWDSPGFSSGGYHNDIYCSYNITIKPKTEIYVTAALYIEPFIDIITYYTGNGKSGVISNESEFYLSKEMIFYSDDRYVSFEFLSDGSFQGSGFTFTFQEIDCECNPNNITCNGELFNVMKNNSSPIVCSEILCQFFVEPCNASMTHLVIDILDSTYRDNLIFQIYSNQELVFDMVTSPIREYYDIFLNSSNENIVKIHTFRDTPKLFSSMKTEAYLVPFVDQYVTFTSIKTFCYLDLGTFTLAIFEKFESFIMQNKYYVVYGSYRDYVYRPLIYNNETLAIDLVKNNNCIFYPTTFKCNIYDKKFAVLTKTNYHMDPNGQFLAIHLSNETKNCVFEENVFIPKNAASFTVAQLSNKNGECIVKFFFNDNAYGDFMISHLWTTSLTENVQIFSGLDQNRLFLEFNSKTAILWKEIRLFSHFYSVKIPKNSAIFIRINASGYNPVITISFPFRSLVSTPYYATTKSASTGIFISYIINENDYVKFSALDYKFEKQSNDYFSFFVDDNSFLVNQTGDTLIFNNQSVGLYYDCYSGKDINEGAVFLVEVFQCN